MTPRETWRAFLHGEDVGSLVAPLVDDWCLEIPYTWPYADADPFPPGHRYHSLSQQMAMAQVCGYDALYYAGVPFVTAEPIETRVEEREEQGRTIAETRTTTPYGELCSIIETATSTHTLKAEVETAEDYAKMRWLVEQRGRLNVDASVQAGQVLRRAVGERGMLGTWWGPPGVPGINREDQFVHMAEFADEYREVVEAQFQASLAQLPVMKAMGFDFLFYCVDGTEWISPGYFEEFVAPYTRETFARWRALGGFVVWHSCGHVAEFIKRGYYNEFLPEIFETMSEEPFGNLPSLRWGREQLDPRIATKGNVDLQLIHDGPIERIRAEVQRVKAETAGYRHIIGASDDILHDTPLAHLQAFVEEARR